MQPPILWPPLETVRQSLRQEAVSIVDQDEMGSHLTQANPEAVASVGARNDHDSCVPLQVFARRQQAFLERNFQPGLIAGRLVNIEFQGFLLNCLLDVPLEQNRWWCFVVSPECDWAGRYDVLLEPRDEPFDPVCGMVQTWHRITLRVDQNSRILGELSVERMNAIRAVHDEFARANAVSDAHAPSQPGKIALRSVAQHAVLTGTPLSENDPRLLYQGLYRDHVQDLILAQQAATPLQTPAGQISPSPPSNWLKKIVDWFSVDWLIRPAFSLLSLLVVAQMLLPINAPVDSDIRFRGAPNAHSLTVYWRHGTSSEAITQVLREFNALIVSGPDPQGAYIVQAPEPTVLQTELRTLGLADRIVSATD